MEGENEHILFPDGTSTDEHRNSSQTENHELSRASRNSSSYAVFVPVKNANDRSSSNKSTGSNGVQIWKTELSSDSSKRSFASGSYASIATSRTVNDRSSVYTSSSTGSSQTRNNVFSTPWDRVQRLAIFRPGNPCGIKLQDLNAKPSARGPCSRPNLLAGAFFGVLVLIVITAVTLLIILNNPEEAQCEFFINKVICPLKPEYNKIDILSPPSHLKDGNGRISYDLNGSTDVTIGDLNIRVHDGKVFVQKQPVDCTDEAEYPVIFSGKSDSNSETKFTVKIQDETDVVEMGTTPFVNITDNKEYVQLRCTGYHKCGTVVMDVEVKIKDFGTYSSPMDCSRTNIDGTVMDSYGYSCTLIMTLDTFKRTDSLKCKPTVATLQNATTPSIEQQSVVISEGTRSNFTLKKGENSTIMFNVDVQSMYDIRHLQNGDNVYFPSTDLDRDARVTLSTNITGHIATSVVEFRPPTCIDDGLWKLHLLNHIQDKRIKVTGTPTFTPCPPVVNVQVGKRRHLDFSYCVPDDVHTYALDLYGKMNKTGSFLRDKPIRVEDKNISFQALLNYNELSVVYKDNDVIKCSDHMTEFTMSLKTKADVTKWNITSLTNAKVGHGDYTTYSTGGDFRENLPAYVSLSVNLGCRPENITIHINGSLLTSTYNLTVDSSTGEKIFSKSFSFPKITMSDNGSLAEVHSSFIDDDGSRRNLNITQEIRVLEDSFCQEKPHGCHYIYPYNRNMWVACGEGVIAAFLNCQRGLVFVQSNCKGKCCYEQSTEECQSVY